MFVAYVSAYISRRRRMLYPDIKYIVVSSYALWAAYDAAILYALWAVYNTAILYAIWAAYNAATVLRQDLGRV